jgi:hypothetical protein
VETTLEDGQSQAVLDAVLDHALERTGAVGRFEALVGEGVRGRFGRRRGSCDVRPVGDGAGPSWIWMMTARSSSVKERKRMTSSMRLTNSGSEERKGMRPPGCSSWMTTTLVKSAVRP